MGYTLFNPDVDIDKLEKEAKDYSEGDNRRHDRYPYLSGMLKALLISACKAVKQLTKMLDEANEQNLSLEARSDRWLTKLVDMNVIACPECENDCLSDLDIESILNFDHCYNCEKNEADIGVESLGQEVKEEQCTNGVKTAISSSEEVTQGN